MSTRSPAYVPRSSSTIRPNSPNLPIPPSSLGHGHGLPIPPKPYPHGNRGHNRSPSLPTSPNFSSFVPRSTEMEKKGSSLRHEVTEGRNRTGEMSEGAKAILKVLSNLPAPLSGILPPTFLPSPNPTPSPPDTKSFSDYARLDLKRKNSPEDGVKGIGLGLGLTMSTFPEVKKRKLSTPSPPDSKTIPPIPSPKFPLKSPELVRSVSSPVQRLAERSITPGDRSSPLSKKEGRDGRGSGLKMEITDGMGSWTREQFIDSAQSLRARALLCKRHGDAYSRSSSAQPQYVKQLPMDKLRGLLCLTDAVLLWLFAYWLEEQTSTRIRASPYNESQPLREFVRKCWESEMRKADDEVSRERAKAMVGLMHLIEAVVCYHLNSEQLAHLTRKTKELSQSVNSGSIPLGTTSSNHGPSPSSSNGSPGNTGPSPAAHSTSSHNASGSPESHTSQCVSDLLPIISNSTSSIHRAHQYLLNSRHHLSLGVLRTRFPETFDAAIHSDLSDEALPAPGDNLGAAKSLDIDIPDRFAWPIELGMHCPVAHTAVFGRRMVSEYGRARGDWNLKLE